MKASSFVGLKPFAFAIRSLASLLMVATAAGTTAETLYVANRAPLQPGAFIKLPIGSIKPEGWLRHQLELEADGMTGHLEEISKWCKFEDSAWASPDGQGKFGWEELPYWLKGYGDLGYVLKDGKIIKEARKWIDAVLASQEPDGFFGPRANKTGLDGHPDLWPHMVMLNVLQSFYEYSHDERVLPFMTRYLRWLNGRPGEDFGRGYWPRIRFGDTIESAYWLYNRTGDAFLLDLAKKIHDHMEPWTTGVHNWHNVNVSQGFREPGVYFLQARDEKFLRAAERNYETVMSLYGQFPGGGFAGDENARPGFTDPHQGFETCGIVEFMHSFEMLTKISGNAIWSDRCEDIAFNSFPAALAPDWKGLHYLTCANQVALDRANHAPGVENSGTMFSYSPFEVYRCCQHNVSHGWPYYAEELWLASTDHGLCASLFAASEVTAKVGDGRTVRISEETDYPFSDTITLKFSTAQPVKFPLHLRIPGWCQGASARVNGRSVSLKTKPLSHAMIEREWKDGDLVTLKLPMRIAVRRWEKNHDAASVNYGPLTFSLKIGERWTRYGGTDAWPEREVHPTTAWNYGLVLNARNPAKSFEVVKRSGPLAANPFTPETAPVALRARVKKIPQWKTDRYGLAGKLQDSPVRSGEPVETVTLIPMGAARLRISSFPVIGSGSSAHDWNGEKASAVSASHCFERDTVEAAIDGVEPKSSNDHNIPRFTWWDHRGTVEWIERGFVKPRKVSAVEVYWFEDGPAGGCRVPKSWKLLHKTRDVWRPV
ncbi:MAG TPA: beta-L-arabinofuranosidase domain-containing protein, partial [Candidatus Angelobacter sp.]|nr:beta-L-arabinofuranosidase domain-containing protein [Candidatus Angelobacter sp.]